MWYECETCCYSTNSLSKAYKHETENDGHFVKECEESLQEIIYGDKD